MSGVKAWRLAKWKKGIWSWTWESGKKNAFPVKSNVSPFLVLFCFPILQLIKYLCYLSITCIPQVVLPIYRDFPIISPPVFFTRITANFSPYPWGREAGSEQLCEFLAVSQGQPTTFKMKRNKWIKWQITFIDYQESKISLLLLNPSRSKSELFTRERNGKAY